jgi:hypothetical protein
VAKCLEQTKYRYQAECFKGYKDYFPRVSQGLSLECAVLEETRLHRISFLCLCPPDLVFAYIKTITFFSAFAFTIFIFSSQNKSVRITHVFAMLTQQN